MRAAARRSERWRRPKFVGFVFVSVGEDWGSFPTRLSPAPAPVAAGEQERRTASGDKRWKKKPAGLVPWPNRGGSL